MNPCLTIRKANPRDSKQVVKLKATVMDGDYICGKGNQEKSIVVLKNLFNLDANRSVIKEY